MTTDLYILDDNNQPVPVPEEDLMGWGRWLDQALASGRRIVGDDGFGGFHIKTVFGGCDSNWDGGAPLLFETRVTEDGERRDLFLRRYATWVEAVQGHAAVCQQVRGGA